MIYKFLWKIKIFWLWIAFWIGIFLPSAKAQIVVFPFEDLAQDSTGINVEIAEVVADYLAQEGFQVISPREVIPELARLRVKNPGWVDRVVAREILRRFKARFILLGTVLERDETEPALGLSVRILRVEDYRVVWGGTASFSGKDWHPFLGLKKVSFDYFLKEVCQNLFAGLKEELGTQALPPPTVEIDEILIRPRSVRAGDSIECALRLRFSGPEPSYLGLELTNGRRVPLLKNGPFYLAFWKAPKEEGRYAINLIVEWEGTWEIKKKLFLATYLVDNTPPPVELEIYRVRHTPQGLAFRRYVEIRPRLLGGDRIARWQLEILPGDKERPLVKEEQPGKLPPRFIWRGTDGRGRPVPAGPYRVRLKVWDEAGNLSQKEVRLIVVKEPPKAQVRAIKESGKLKLSLEVEKHPVPLKEWRLEIWDAEGNLVKELRGKGPIREDLVFKEVPTGLRYTLVVRDILGNRLLVRNKRIVPKVLRAEKKEEEKFTPQAEEWVGEF